MKARAFLLPGQGSQAIGMGRDLFADDPSFRRLVEVGSEAVGTDLERLCLRGPDRELRRSSVVQPLVVAVSLGYLAQLRARGIAPDVVAGHSLGEITALAAAGVISPEEAVEVAAVRGKLMEEAANRHGGGMVAVLQMPLADVEAHLEAVEAGSVVLANDNAPGQAVVSGEDAALEAFVARVRSEGGRCRALAVSGPWHSPLLRGAQAAFAANLDERTFGPPAVPLVLNATGAVEQDPARIKELLAGQLTSPVRWRASMACLLARGVRAFLEVGPGRVLAGLARLNGVAGAIRIYGVGDLRGLDRAVRDLQPGDYSAGGGK